MLDQVYYQIFDISVATYFFKSSLLVINLTCKSENKDTPDRRETIIVTNGKIEFV